jgi:hypothetical protein
MSEGQSQRSVASSVQHWQEAEVAVAEERERAAAETAATAARAARLAMAELAAARVEVEAAMAADAACAAAVELEALRASSTGSSVFVDDDRDNELKLARKVAREQAAQWAAVSPMVVDVPAALQAGVCAAAVSPTVVAAQTGADAPVAGLTETAAFTGGVALPPRTGTMVIMGSRPLSRTSVPATGGLPSSRPTTLSGPW